MAAFQYLGDIAPYIPKDANGNALPYYILVEGTGNDDSQAGLQAAATSLYEGLAVAYPTASIIVTGRWMTEGVSSATAIATDAAYSAAYATALTAFPQLAINGKSAFIDLFNGSGVGYLNGHTNIGSPSGSAGINTDAYVYTDGTHPAGQRGHWYFANQIEQKLMPLLMPRAR